MKTIITIGREFGSGGHEIGFRLAEELGIPFYDKLLVSMVAEEGEFAQKYLEEMDEKVNIHIAPFLATRSNYSVYNQPVSDKIFFRQAEIIRKLADEGACVIVGRCADYILEKHPDLLRVFLFGELKDRVARKEAMNLEIEESDMTKHVQNTDKKRSRYYRHYTGKVWGDRDNYDLCINTSVIGINETVELLKRLVLAREEEK
ncbi:MAG: cytidylate kinase-like family protein [Firmicutes bacterium]|jgi:cytidylate kinase|nr:cytidylate kinase-like family protein [Bacillota bacterium]